MPEEVLSLRISREGSTLNINLAPDQEKTNLVWFNNSSFTPIELDFYTANSLRNALESNGMPSSDLVNNWPAKGFGLRDWTVTLIDLALAMWKAKSEGRLNYSVTLCDCLEIVSLMESELHDLGMQGFVAAVKRTIVDKLKQQTDAMEIEYLLYDIIR